MMRILWSYRQPAVLFQSGDNLPGRFREHHLHSHLFSDQYRQALRQSDPHILSAYEPVHIGFSYHYRVMKTIFN
ncbi:hypothetical protein [Domibacillus sp. PGB-M46]|uniref:hypothetical protein n=1 Tax=Domibacillus sp. PGB-M46 TaxID=2910255 RepID=UPI0028163DFF|nr:hypothetical protein [Domibacillus sp. PGB-M46]